MESQEIGPLGRKGGEIPLIKERREIMVGSKRRTRLRVFGMSTFFLDFDSANPPDPPSQAPQWTRFVCISDTHSSTRAFVPDGDVLLHSGDLTNTGELEAFENTVDWLCSLPHKQKM